MEWQDQAIIISKQIQGNSSLIIKVISYNHGIYKGMIKGAKNHKNNHVYEIGNLISCKWRARTDDHLGYIKVEEDINFSSYVMYNKSKLYSLLSIAQILDVVLPERVICMEIYKGLYDLLYAMYNNNDYWKKLYLIMEFNLLSYLGFGLDLMKCTVTNSKSDLAYISPKSGKAVSSKAGYDYRDKLIPINNFLLNYAKSNNIDHELSLLDLYNGLNITRFFLKKFVFSEFIHKFPAIRNKLNESFELKKEEI